LNCWHKDDKHANVAEAINEVRSDSILLIAHDDSDSQDEVWYLDSGASNHMCGKKYLFVELTEGVRGKVNLGDSSKLPVEGKGKIKICQNDGKKGYISDVYYVPNMKSNILSIGQLLEKGYTIHMENYSLILRDARGGIMAHVPMTNHRMFPLHLNIKSKKCFYGLKESESWKWHLRFGHLHFSGLKLLSSAGMVHGLPVIEPPSNACEGCILGKQARLSFPNGKSWRATSPLQLVHTDICGPIEPMSLEGNRFFITFIDDFSRKLWVYFLKEKSDAFIVFKNFKALVENQSGHKLVTLRSDRGGEYTSKEFDKYCREHGIKHQLTAAYTPQQNGIAKRKNRTILNMTRTMLKEKGLPKQFWAEAMACSSCLLNRCPTKSVKNMTPQEAWSGYKPSVAHLRIFGCVAYSQVPESKRKKLDDRGEKCIFLGYSEESKAYKLYNPLTKKLVVSRDVIFDEERVWSWSDEKKAKEQQLLEEPEELSTKAPPSTPPSSLPTTLFAAHRDSTPSMGGSSSRSSTNQSKMRSLREIYEQTEDGESNLFCLYADHEPLTFQEPLKKIVGDLQWRRRCMLFKRMTLGS
jgi:transposase InsO family protein